MEEEDFSSDTSDEDYVPDGNARLTQYIINWRLVLCPENRGRFFRKKGMSPNFGDTFFGKRLCPRLLMYSTDGATLLSKVLAQTN